MNILSQTARYNMFYVLYPLGISSECWLVYGAIKPAAMRNKAYEYALKTILFIYIPGERIWTSNIKYSLIYILGSYILFTHMIAQRRKMMRGKQRQRIE